jgi:hypothetical protein
MTNRRFARKFPVPTVLGIEEFLDGPLLSYINELDHIAIGFEAGQHDDKTSIEHHIAFVSLVLLYAGLIDEIDFPDYQRYAQKLKQAGKLHRGIYEIRSRFEIERNDAFTMYPGYQSFQRIKKDQVLAEYEGRKIRARKNGQIFMPLYQNQGEDGFFIIRKIPLVWLKLSSLLRKIRFDNFLLTLPGISRDNANSKTLIVNTRVARFYGKEIFHLLGYRMKSKAGNSMKFTRRESL